LACQIAGVRLLAGALAIALFGTSACSGSPNGHRASPARRVPPSALVNPFMGTGVGGAAVGAINASPAADVPLGMMQWGPDTAPVRAPGGGYRDGQHAISGFSLTHLSGPGCPAYGDIPILPTAGARSETGEASTARFRASSQHATPGRYSVTLAQPAIGVDVAVTTRTGLARITFPPV